MVATAADRKRYYSPDDAHAEVSRLANGVIGWVNPRVMVAAPQLGDCGRVAYHVVAESPFNGRTCTRCADGYMHHV